MFNVGRKNSSKRTGRVGDIKERHPEISAAICALPPLFLDELFMKKLDRS